MPAPEPVPAAGGDAYLLSHWRQYDPSGWSPERGEDTSVSLSELNPHVLPLMQKAESGRVYESDAPLSIELNGVPPSAGHLTRAGAEVVSHFTRHPKDAPSAEEVGKAAAMPGRASGCVIT
ncbi:hypothetical protein ABZU32_18980 [Sphaerisporangium sp. NPDC005288]|uniref:hypothetical protein n=1 Tax=Sphaerisporangium sp. NPDC005288 TaxID=3155114 RepID=UPI0033AC957A